MMNELIEMLEDKGITYEKINFGCVEITDSETQTMYSVDMTFGGFEVEPSDEVITIFYNFDDIAKLFEDYDIT